MPLDIIGELYEFNELLHIAAFMVDGNVAHLQDAVHIFICDEYPSEPDAMLDLARHFEDGAAKYGERNWERGIPTHCYIDSAVRHYFKHLRGDTDEPHGRAFLWNLLCCAWTVRHLPEYDDIPHRAT